MLEMRPATCDAGALQSYSALFAACFPDAAHLGPEYLTWLYAGNPDGPVVGFDAWSGNRLAAHYACIPAAAVLDGEPRRVLLSLNTATHPDFQGQGLFTRLAQATYDHAAELGYAMVYGVANANSTPGFVRKLGFSLAGPLDARVGWGRIEARSPREAQDDASFFRVWNRESLAWRRANPTRTWQVHGTGNGSLACWVPTGTPGIDAWSELPNPRAFPSGREVATGSACILA